MSKQAKRRANKRARELQATLDKMNHVEPNKFLKVPTKAQRHIEPNQFSKLRQKWTGI